MGIFGQCTRQASNVAHVGGGGGKAGDRGGGGGGGRGRFKRNPRAHRLFSDVRGSADQLRHELIAEEDANSVYVGKLK